MNHRYDEEYCRTHNVRVCLYIAYIACGSASLYMKTLYFFICTLALSAAATVANISYDAKTPQFAIFGTRVICVFYSTCIQIVTIIQIWPIGVYLGYLLSSLFTGMPYSHAHLGMNGLIQRKARVNSFKYYLPIFWSWVMLTFFFFIGLFGPLCIKVKVAENTNDCLFLWASLLLKWEKRYIYCTTDKRT